MTSERHLDFGEVDFGQIDGIFPICGFLDFELCKRGHDERLVALHAGADLCAHAAAHAVERGDLHTELIALDAGRGLGVEVCGLFCAFRNEGGTDAGVRADEGALVALHAVFLDPLGHHDGDAALFELGRAGGDGTVRIEGGGRQLIAFEREDGRDDVPEVVVVRKLDHLGAFRRRCPRFGDVDLDEVFFCGVDRVVVHLHDGVALSCEGLVRHLLHEVDRLGSAR